jgi:trk system potassium uptake protein TrkA
LGTPLIVRLVKRTAGNEIIDIADGQTQVMATRVHEGFTPGPPETENPVHDPQHLSVQGRGHCQGITTILPGGDHEILPQDQVLIMASKQDLPKLMALTGVKQQRRHRVMILGGGLVGSAWPN